MNRILALISLILIAFACEDYHYSAPPGDSLEFYLMSGFQRQTNSYKIINSTVKLSDSIIIRYDDILSYNPHNYTFTITKSLADRLDNLHGTPFAVTVEKQIIYTGYFWAGFSSSMVDWITIDPLNYSGKNQLRVQLGYPGLVEGDFIPDNRNDERILEVLKRDFKLIDK
jgi:hypothetical protein